ncbi:hypothetical protein CP989_24990, partial [Enterobacter hormaechei]|uniref:hypothetical protein n=1 Tax=Enterobacter hormaechei TaxID=158836 RepID=UPI000BD59AB8
KHAEGKSCRNLFMLGALGSRGLCTAPLSAELLAAQMSAEPLPLDSDTLAALNPNRLWVRKHAEGKSCRNLFMLGALGSRGLCTAPLSAELLA